MRRALAIVLLAAAVPSGAQESAVPGAGHGDAMPLASQLDYTRPESRDQPIRCRDGDIAFFPGKTVGDLFGSAWPQPPAGQAEPVTQVRAQAPRWPAGLGQSGAIVVTVVLVGADGRAVEARALCATAPAIAAPAERAALNSRYAPATVDGVPVTGVATQVYRFEVRDRQHRPGAHERQPAAGARRR